MAPGVSWPDCHIAADHEILTALVGVGVLVGDVAAMQVSLDGTELGFGTELGR